MELQHIRQNINKSYSLGVRVDAFGDPTDGGLEGYCSVMDNIQQIADVQARHVDIISDIIDMFETDDEDGLLSASKLMEI